MLRHSLLMVGLGEDVTRDSEVGWDKLDRFTGNLTSEKSK